MLNKHLADCSFFLTNVIPLFTMTDILPELEANLKDLEEIKGSLRVSRSQPLVSLHFFKKLKIIGGESLEMEKYSLSVYDNPNLKELFPWNETRSLHINKGSIFFHLNPYLCLSKIWDFSIYSNIHEWDQRDVSNSTNGEKATCDLVKIDLTLSDLDKIPSGRNDTIDESPKPRSQLMFHWNNVREQFHDKRNLISYKIYYRIALTNVTKYDGRDACSTEWRDFELAMDPPREDPQLEIFCPVALKPFTRYAFYISTYTVSRAERGGESDIIYYTTPPTKPSEPVIETLVAISQTEVYVQWSKPKYSNGIITHYKIIVQEFPSEAEPGVDYCKHKIDNFVASQTSSQVFNAAKSKTEDSPLPDKYLKQKETVAEDDQCCQQCKANKIINEEDRGDFISFENYMMNHIFQQNTLSVYKPSNGDEGNRTKRSVPTSVVEDQSLDSSTLPTTSATVLTSTDSVSSTLADLSNSSTESSVPLTNATDQSNENGNTTTEPSNSTSTNNPIIYSSPPRKVAEKVVYIVNATGADMQSFTVRNLTHFSMYKIKVNACQSDPRNYVPCSETYQFVQTPPNPEADYVQHLTVHPPALLSLGTSKDVSENETDINPSYNELVVKFEEPKTPNAVIVSFKVEYAPKGKSGQGAYTACIPYSNYRDNQQTIRLSDIPPGQYILKVKANSLAGLSDSDLTLPSVEFTVSDPKAVSTWITITIVLSVGVLFVIVVSLGSVFYVRKQRQYLPDHLDYMSMNPEYMSGNETIIFRLCIILFLCFQGRYLFYSLSLHLFLLSRTFILAVAYRLMTQLPVHL
jgi:insulin receptor